jgi:hypothetical protein
MTTYAHDEVVPDKQSTLAKKRQVADMFNDISGDMIFSTGF